MLEIAFALMIAGSEAAREPADQSCLVMFGTNTSLSPPNDYVWGRTLLSLRQRNASGNRAVLVWSRWLGGPSEAENKKVAARQAEELKMRIVAAKIPATEIRTVVQGSAMDSGGAFLAITFGSPVRDSASASSPLTSC